MTNTPDTEADLLIGQKLPGGHMLRVLVSIAVIAVLPLVSGCDERVGRRVRPELRFRLPVINTAPKTFANCAALQNSRDKKWNAWNRANNEYYDWLREVGGGAEPVSSTAGSSNSGASAGYSSNNQEAGVDEPDLAKVDGNRIFYVRKTGDIPTNTYAIEIMSANTLEPIQTIQLESYERPRILTFDGELAVISSTNSESSISFFGLKRGKHEIKKTFTTRAQYVDARMIDGEIFFVGRRWVGGESFNVSTMSVPCEQILESAIDDFSFDLTEVHKISFRDSSVESSGRLGRTDQIYMTAKHLYLFSAGYTWFQWDPRLADDRVYGTSTVTRFDVGKLKDDSRGTAFIDGRIRNQFSFGESSDGASLFIATTTFAGVGTSSRLWTLQEEGGRFTAAGYSREFGLGETIRSVRFVGDRAYVVTFRFSDPLFTFDISDPRKVRLMSHLEIPGFSAYLHPVMNGKLFGAGYQADARGITSGLQFSLFDPQTDGTVEVSDRLEMGSTSSHVDVSRDHHAFLYHKEQNVVSVPLRIVGTDRTIEFAGALALQITDKITIAANWTHRDLTPPQCIPKEKQFLLWSWAQESHDIQRVVQAPCGIVTLSPFGAKLHRSSAPWDELATKKFNGTNVGSQGCLNTY